MDKEIALVQSKTFWGALLALLAVVAQAMGWASVFTFATDPATQTAILGDVSQLLNIVAAGGAAFAIFGRYVAKSKVTAVLPPGSGSGTGSARAAAVFAVLVLGAALAGLPGCSARLAADACAGAEAGAAVGAAVATAADSGANATRAAGQVRQTAVAIQNGVSGVCPPARAAPAAGAGR